MESGLSLHLTHSKVAKPPSEDLQLPALKHQLISRDQLLCPFQFVLEKKSHLLLNIYFTLGRLVGNLSMSPQYNYNCAFFLFLQGVLPRDMQTISLI